MIQRLLSKYRNKRALHRVSESYEVNESLDVIAYRYYGDFMMRFLLVAWLVFQCYTYYQVAQRPPELFTPINWFDKLFMTSLPGPFLWWSVVLVVFFVNGSLLLNKGGKWQRFVLAMGVLWVNCIRWKFEFFSHVGHLIVLYHLLSVFLPQKKQAEKNEVLDYARAIKWFFAGLLVGYSMSGVWKVVGFVYKVIFKPSEMTWFHPDAMVVNSAVGFRDWDVEMGALLDLFELRWIWQMLFVVMLLLQLGSVLGAVRIKILPYIALGNILFHLANVLFVRIEFYVAPLVLLITFFPYHLLFRSKDKLDYDQEYVGGLLTRKYRNGHEDVFSGFYAYREYKYGKRPLIWGVLYLPGVSLLARPFFKSVTYQ